MVANYTIALPVKWPEDMPWVESLGAISALGSVTIHTFGMGTVGVQITGTWVATMTPEFTINDVDWIATQFWDIEARTTRTTVTDVAGGNGIYKVMHPPGAKRVRVRASAYTSGTANIFLFLTKPVYELPQYIGVSGTDDPQQTAWVGGRDPAGAVIQGVAARNAAPAAADWGLVVRVAGTVTVSDTATLVDDAAFTPATSRVMMAGFEFDDVAPDSVDEGDGGAARMSANRNVYTQVRDAAGNERGVNVNASNQMEVNTELPAAAALGDADVNPTTPLIGACGMTLDAGGAWERVRSADSLGAAYGGLGLPGAALMRYNRTNWDSYENNVQGTLLASAARVADTTTADQVNYNAKGVYLHLNITANPAGGETLTVVVQVRDPVSSTYRAITSFPAIAAANGDFVYMIYPGAAETVGAANVEIQGLPLPRPWRVLVDHSAVGSWTYSLGYSYMGG